MIELRSFDWILRGTGDTVAATFYADGEVADPGVVTVDIVAPGGATVATARAAGGTGAAARTVALAPAETAKLGLLTLTWHATIATVPMLLTTTAEIVGAQLFTVAEARAFDKGQLSSATLYPEAAIEEARGRIAEAFASICGVQFIPRRREAVLDGFGDTQAGGWGYGWSRADTAARALGLPDVKVTSLVSVETREAGTAVWTTFGPDDLADVILEPEGLIHRETRGTWPRGRQNVRAAYVCGFAEPPLDIRRAALILAVNQLVPRDIGDRALSISSEVGTFRLSVAGERGAWFGFPNVDAVLDQYVGYRVPQIR